MDSSRRSGQYSARDGAVTRDGSETEEPPDRSHLRSGAVPTHQSDALPLLPKPPRDGDGAVAVVVPGGRRGRRAGSGRGDLSTGSVPRHVWRLAWPQWIENVLGIIDQMVDLFWAGRLPGGHFAIAGVGVANTFTNFGMQARNGMDQGLRAMVSRAVGAGDIPLANHIALQAFTFTFAYSVVMIAIGWVLTDLMLRAIGASDTVRAETALFMQIEFMGVAALAFRQSSAVTLQASGDVITPLKATTITRVIGIILTPFLMFGWLGFPEWGLAGAAVTNLLAQGSGAALNFYALFRGTSLLHLTLRGYRVDVRILGQLLRIGIPAAFGGMERSVSQLVLLGIVTPFGDVAVAGYALARRLEMFSLFGSMGIGNASGVMVGQNLGAGLPHRAIQSVRWGLVYVTATTAVIGLTLYAAPEFFVRVFTAQPDVVALMTDWLRVLAAGAVFMGMGQVFQQSFNTAGDTLTVTVVTFISLIVIELPVAWFLSVALGAGPLGIAYAHLVGMAMRTAIFVPLFFWGRWLRIKVL